MLPVVQIETARIKEANNRYMSTADREAIIALLSSVNVKTFVEIGVNYGFTARVILDNTPSIEKYTGIDVQQGYVPAMAQQKNEVPTDPGTLVLNDPQFNLVLRRNGSFDLKPSDIGQCDAMLIDGDHGRLGVLNDTELARACVRAGGVIIWHDYHAEATVDVLPVLNEMADGGAPIKHCEGTWVAFERV